MRISVEEIEQMYDRRCLINSQKLEDIIWTKNGVDIIVIQDRIKEFQFTGLSNIDFVLCGFLDQKVDFPWQVTDNNQ